MRIIKYSILILGLWTAVAAQAQTTTNSPYSIYGIGDQGSRSFANQRTMGTAQTAHLTPNYVNFMNPATYSGIRVPVFSADVNFDNLNVEAPTSSQNYSSAYLSNIALGFPVGKRAGFAVGINQYTQMGYNITANQYDSLVGNYDFIYQGDGGISQVVGGIGIAPIQNSKHRLSIGANIIYYFGFAQTSRAVTNFIDDPAHLSSKLKNKTNVNDVAFDFGLHYRFRLDTVNYLSVGAFYAPSMGISSTNQQVSYSYFPNNDLENIRDTVTNTEVSGDITFPSSYGAGISAQLNRRWTINADYRITNWSELQLFGRAENLKDRSDLAFGLEYLPDPDAIAKFVPSLRYRAGLRFTETRLHISDEQLSEYTVSLGLGVPILKTKSKSTLNLGIDFGQRGNNLTTGVREGFTRFYFGIAFSPVLRTDPWFKPRKYE